MRTFALKTNFFRITKRCQFIFHKNVMISKKMRKLELSVTMLFLTNIIELLCINCISPICSVFRFRRLVPKRIISTSMLIEIRVLFNGAICCWDLKRRS